MFRFHFWLTPPITLSWRKEVMISYRVIQHQRERRNTKKRMRQEGSSECILPDGTILVAAFLLCAGSSIGSNASERNWLLIPVYTTILLKGMQFSNWAKGILSLHVSHLVFSPSTIFYVYRPNEQGIKDKREPENTPRDQILWKHDTTTNPVALTFWDRVPVLYDRLFASEGPAVGNAMSRIGCSHGRGYGYAALHGAVLELGTATCSRGAWLADFGQPDLNTYLPFEPHPAIVSRRIILTVCFVLGPTDYHAHCLCRKPLLFLLQGV